MKLIKFNLTKKKDVYVNIDHIAAITPYGANKTIIRLGGFSSSMVVLHNIEYVLSKLKDHLEL